MSATRGSKITLKIGANLFQGLVSKSFNMTIEAEDATNQDSGGAKTHNPGDLACSISFKSMLDPSHTQGVQEIMEAAVAKTQVTYLIEGSVSGEPTITGTGTITNITLNADHGSTASCDGTITGDNLPTIGTVV